MGFEENRYVYYAVRTFCTNNMITEYDTQLDRICIHIPQVINPTADLEEGKSACIVSELYSLVLQVISQEMYSCI